MKYFIHFLCSSEVPRVHSRIFALWDPKNTNLRVPQNNFSSLCPKSFHFSAFFRFYQHFRVPQFYFASVDPCILPDIALLLAGQGKAVSWQNETETPDKTAKNRTPGKTAKTELLTRQEKRSMTCVIDRFCYIL